MPFAAGVVQETVTVPLPRVTRIAVGASGAAPMTVLADAVEASEVPAVFVAVTVNVWVEPVERPVTVQVNAGEPPSAVDVQVLVGSRTDFTVYDVTGEPLATDATHETFALESAPTAVTAVGADGTAAGTTLADAADATEIPAALVAFTVNE